MRVLIVTIGSRGDVQPYVALGCALKASGHVVTIGTHTTFETLVKRHGLDFAAVGGDIIKEMDSPQFGRWAEDVANPLKFIASFGKAMEKLLPGVAGQMMEPARHADVIVGSGTTFFCAALAAQALALPCVCALVQPFHPTREFPSAYLSAPIRSAWWNYLTYARSGLAFWKALGPVASNIRKQLALPARSPLVGLLEMSRKRVPVLYGFSNWVVGRPEDWPQHVTVTGYWFLDEPDWLPPADLLEFLSDGPAPVCVGFGSMRDSNPEKMTEVVLSALLQVKERGILLTGWGGLTQRDLPDTVFLLKDAPHSWLFPKAKAIVHHGGAGTSGAAFRSGVPSVVVPFFGDQRFWAHRACQLGVSPNPIARRDLSASSLAARLTEVLTSTSMRDRAALLGERIAAERGGVAASDVLNRYFSP